MHLTFTLLISSIACIQVIAASPVDYSQAGYSGSQCLDQASSCYQQAETPSTFQYNPQPELSGDEEMEQPSNEEMDDDQMPMLDTTESSDNEQSSLPEFSAMNNLNIAGLQPAQALLDNVNGHSSSKADALSNSNQFDQTQLIDQTLYQPQQPQPQIIITQPAIRSRGGRYKKYKRSARKHFKIRYFSGNRHY